MHIPEAILAGTEHGREILAAGAMLTAAGTAVGLKKIDYERIPQIAVLCAAFFVISAIHVPLGPTSVHLVLCGLMGLVLGWAAFPAVLVALLLQSVFLSFGGLTALGLNTLIMAAPAVACYYLFGWAVRTRHEPLVATAAFAAGSFGLLLGALLAAVSLFAAGKSFEVFGQVVMGVHLLTAVVEGLVTGSVVVLLRKVRPELLDAPLLSPSVREAAHG